MTERTVWHELYSAPKGLVVIYDDGIALVDDGDHLWIADGLQLRAAIRWARITPVDSLINHEPYASFWGRCPGWIVEDLREGDDFPLDIPACMMALRRSGFEDSIPAHWDRDEEVF